MARPSTPTAAGSPVTGPSTPTGAGARSSGIGAALIAIIGPIAAAGLFVAIPAEESGRKVEATVQVDGTIAVHHVSGRQYLDAYLDIVGVATACDGLTRGVKLGQHYSEEQCGALLERELLEHATHVMACTPGLKPAGHDQQRIAAVSLSYNIGWPRYCKSTAVRRFNAGQYAGACDAFLMWDKAGGRPVLRARRERERARCLKDVAR